MGSNLAALFQREDVGVQSLSIVAGEALFSAGEASDRLFLVREGLFAALDGHGMAERQIGLIGRGEVIGEMALAAGTRHRRTVAALRDSTVDVIHAAEFLTEAAADPALLLDVARLIARRASASDVRLVVPNAVLVVGSDPGTDARSFATMLADQCRSSGRRAVAVDSCLLGGKIEGVIDAEASHDLVIISAEANEERWADACRRHVDRILMLGRADTTPPEDCALCPNEPLQRHGFVELVLLHRTIGPPKDVGRWITSMSPARVHHVGPEGGGLARLARMLTGTGVALALSGGGARAFAHVGALRALREAKIPIDAVAGTSMGAIVAAGIASGWTVDELDERMKDAFVRSNPLDDIALPIIAMTRGRKVEARLRKHFGDVRIENMPLPFFCGATNLTTGRWDRSDRGDLVEALRATISLPGVLPPVIRDGSVLADGGLLRNLPADLLREAHPGTVVGCDVTRAMGLMPSDVMPPTSWLRWFASGRWRRGPPLVSILMRSATIAAGREIEIARASCDLYVMPQLDSIEIRDWRAYPRAVEAGYRAMAEAIERSPGPITHLRIDRDGQPLRPC